MVKNKHDCPNSGCFINGRPMGKKHNCCQVSPPNQVSWEDITWDTDGESWWLIYKGEHYSTDGVIKLIRSLLKEERNGIIKMMEKEVIKYSKGEKHSYGQTEQDSGWNACIGFLVSKLSKGEV